MIYLPQDKRVYILSLKLEVGEPVRILYDMKGNLITAERISEEELLKTPAKFVPKKVEDSEEVKAKKLHIQQPKEESIIPPPVGITEQNIYIQQPDAPGDTLISPIPFTEEAKKDVHIHKQTSPAPVLWVSEREKNNTILLQSVLARSVEIVNAQYHDCPIIKYTDVNFQDILDTRCNHIENVADRLFDYAKKKVEQEGKQS